MSNIAYSRDDEDGDQTLIIQTMMMWINDSYSGLSVYLVDDDKRCKYRLKNKYT